MSLRISLKLTVVCGIKFLLLDVYERRLVWTAAELADVSHEIIHAGWTSVKKVRSHLDVFVEQRQLNINEGQRMSERHKATYLFVITAR